jgi:4-aminobutyrate---pyruvate transaminase
MRKTNLSLGQRDAERVVHGYTNLAQHRRDGARVIVSGKGVRVFDDAGKDYIEAASGMWCASLGFGEEALVEAATAQMRKLPYYHTLASKSVVPSIELAERLAALVPIANAKIYFAVSGSEANDFLVKFLWMYNNAIGRPEKKKVISRVNGFHGATIAATSLTGIKKNHLLFDLPLDRFMHVSDMHFYRQGEAGEIEEAFASRLAKELESMILHEGPDTVMAFMAEPVTGGGGVVLPPRTYYAKVQAVLRKYDVLFLADEVINGFGRTGNFFGCETFDIAPSTMTLAKGLTSAYQPLSAIVLPEEIYRGLETASDRVGSFVHGTTYAGNPVATAVALKVLDLMEERDIVGHVRRVAPHFKARLERLLDHPFVGEVRAVGLMGAIEFVADKVKKRAFAPEGSFAAKVRSRAEDFGVITRGAPVGDVIAFSPPLIIAIDEIDEAFDRFTAALDAVTAEA